MSVLVDVVKVLLESVTMPGSPRSTPDDAVIIPVARISFWSKDVIVPPTDKLPLMMPSTAVTSVTTMFGDPVKPWPLLQVCLLQFHLQLYNHTLVIALLLKIYLMTHQNSPLR